MPKRYQDGAFETNLTATTYQKYYSIFGNNENDTEITAVGAAIGGGFNDTNTMKQWQVKIEKIGSNQLKMNMRKWSKMEYYKQWVPAK